jgi:uncharacterized protein (DUF305 family)
LAVAETYDVIVTVPQGQSSVLMATTEDRTRHTTTQLGNGPPQLLFPFARLHYFEGMEMMNNMMSMGGNMTGMPGMDHGGMHGGSMTPGTGMGDMPGMMSSAQMDALKNADGVEASKLFLTGMIKHHQGALTMAQDEIKNGQSADAIALAKSILDSQRKEIDTMNQILGSL